MKSNGEDKNKAKLVVNLYNYGYTIKEAADLVSIGSPKATKFLKEAEVNIRTVSETNKTKKTALSDFNKETKELIKELDVDQGMLNTFYSKRPASTKGITLTKAKATTKADYKDPIGIKTLNVLLQSVVDNIVYNTPLNDLAFEREVTEIITHNSYGKKEILTDNNVDRFQALLQGLHDEKNYDIALKKTFTYLDTYNSLTGADLDLLDRYIKKMGKYLTDKYSGQKFVFEKGFNERDGIITFIITISNELK